MKSLVKLIVVISLFASSSLFAEKILVVGEAFAPFEFIQNGEVVGIDVDIAKHIFAKIGVEPTFKLYAWKRTWSDIENGKADAVFTTSRKSAREPFVIYPKEDMWDSEFVFFVNSSKKQSGFDGYESAKSGGLTVGIVPGNSYHDSFWSAFPYKNGSTEFQGDLATDDNYNDALKTAAGLEQNLKKLAAGRVGLVVADKTVGLYTAKLLGLSGKIEAYDTVLYGKGYPMPFAKKSSNPNIASIAEKFEAELVKMKANGEYQKILDTWLK